MGNSGVGMLLGGDLSATMFWILLLGVFVLGAILFYGITRTSRLSRRERNELEKNTLKAQQREDPAKRTSG
jgi:type VI protein secretion system component VasK